MINLVHTYAYLFGGLFREVGLHILKLEVHFSVKCDRSQLRTISKKWLVILKKRLNDTLEGLHSGDPKAIFQAFRLVIIDNATQHKVCLASLCKRVHETPHAQADFHQRHRPPG